MSAYKPSDIVLSLQGRDKGKLFIVTEVTDSAISLCDGRVRRLCRTKRKNPRHVAKQGESALAEGLAHGNVTDKDIRITLAVFKAEEGTKAWQKTM
jgi:hypothetical protein